MAVTKFNEMLQNGSIIDRLREDFPNISVESKDTYCDYINGMFNAYPSMIFAKYNGFALVLVNVYSYGFSDADFASVVDSGVMSYHIKDEVFLKVAIGVSSLKSRTAYRVNSYAELKKVLKVQDKK